MHRARYGVAGVLMLLILTACELPTGKKDAIPTLFVLPTRAVLVLPTPTPTPTATATVTPSLTPTPPPPTWTPRPTLTPLPPTIAATRARRPTLTPFIPPTYTASPAPVHHESDMPPTYAPPTLTPTIAPTSTVWVPPLEISDETFQFEVLTYPLSPVLVEYYAPWCGPCTLMAPIIEQIACEYYGRLKVVRINVDDNPDHFWGYGLDSIPTLLIFSNGTPLNKKLGKIPIEDVRTWIDGTLGW